jgi:uncharacterized protein (TIGR00266 family)
MKHRILHKPDFAMIQVDLAVGERVSAEAGAMVAMSPDIQIQTSANGGFVKGLKRSMFGGENLFMNTFIAGQRGGCVYLSAKQPGDVHQTTLAGDHFFLQSGSYIASSGDIIVDTKWEGAKSFFGGEGLFMLQCSGTGTLWFSSFGAIHEVAVNGSYVVDTGAIVGFEPSLHYHVKSVGGLKSLMFSGEGLVCEFSGVGKLYLQTRQPASFASWLNPFRPKKANN